jgi:hypothetical protein
MREKNHKQKAQANQTRRAPTKTNRFLFGFLRFALQQGQLALRFLEFFRKSSEMGEDILSDVSFAFLSQVGFPADFTGDGGQRTDLQMLRLLFDKNHSWLQIKGRKPEEKKRAEGNKGEPNLIVGLAVVGTQHQTNTLDRRGRVREQVRFSSRIRL